MKSNHPTEIVSLVTTMALLMVASTPIITRAQSLERQCLENANCAVQPSFEIVGEPTPEPQPETPVQLAPELSNVQTISSEITFEPSVSKVLRVLNDLGSSVDIPN